MSDEQVRTAHHRVTIIYLHASLGLYRNSMCKRADGAAISSLPTEDGTAIASFKFIDCVERSIEAQHAYTAKAVVYRKIGMVGISCNMRLPEVSRRIDGDPTGGMQEEIIRCIDLVRNPENIAQDFCLNGHPDIHRLRHKFNTEGKRTHKTKMWKLVARILYMADSRAQNYSAISIARDFHIDTKKR